MKHNTISPLLIIILFLIFPNTLKCQEYIPFPDSNAIWSEVFTSQQPFQIETYQYGIVGDTIISSVAYHKVYKLNDTIYPLDPGQYCGAIREDNSKHIYVIGCECTFPGSGEGEVLLYDFSKSVGDTVFVGIDGLGPEGYLIISNIDSMLIEDNYRKTFHFNTLYNFYWIEGIGSTRGLFSPITAQPTGFQKWELICFNQDNTIKFLNPEFSTCFPVFTSVDEPKQSIHNVRIFPHPITDISVIEFNNQNFNFQSFELFNMVGQKMEELNIEGKSHMTISADNFKPGLYFFRISGYNMINETGMIIIK
ncbi:MAG: hypothetical protein CSA95_02900 [Bacteroidetes bacterium]|nr:MAG: hypothetical protein CSA95_02900 [Bacteroidota bacterium]